MLDRPPTIPQPSTGGITARPGKTILDDASVDNAERSEYFCQTVLIAARRRRDTCPGDLKAHGNLARMSLPSPTLRTARLRLRPFTSADADALFALHSSAYVLRYWDAPPWSERSRAEHFIAACRRMAEEGSGTRLAMNRVSDKAFIGWCGLIRWNPDCRSASMGYCLDDAAWVTATRRRPRAPCCSGHLTRWT